jgi:hypothetical protein
MLSPHYLIEVWRDGHLDAVDVNVEIKREYRYRLAVDKEHVANTPALKHDDAGPVVARRCGGQAKKTFAQEG